jgi:hypothetical protein
MRDLLLPVVAFAALAPGIAHAADGCPEKASADVVTAFGQPVATLGTDQSIYQPTGVTVLGMPVSYVVVTKTSAGAVGEIDYRFEGVIRKYSERYPSSVLQAFDKSYDAGCASGRVTSCSIVYDTKGASPDQLISARITDPGLDVPKNSDAALLQTIKAEYSKPDSGPVVLACMYGAGL